MLGDSVLNEVIYVVCVTRLNHVGDWGTQF